MDGWTEGRRNGGQEGFCARLIMEIVEMRILKGFTSGS